MANSFLYRMPSGVVGSVTRQLETNVESTYMNSAKPVLAFGAPVKMVSGKIEPIESGDAATVFYGIITRVAPSISGSTAQLFANGIPNPDQLQGVAVRGYVNVTCTQGTPARGGAVYMRVTADTGKAVGDLEAVSDGVKSVVITGAVWAVDGKDANNIAEVRINA